MKQWSRWFAAGLLVVVLSVNAAAVAAEPAEDKTVKALDGLCGQCGAQALWEGEPTYSSWGYAGETACVHEGGVWSDLDECQVRVAVRRFGCRNCGYRDAEATIEEQFIHIGNPKRIKYVL